MKKVNDKKSPCIIKIIILFAIVFSFSFQNIYSQNTLIPLNSRSSFENYSEDWKKDKNIFDLEYNFFNHLNSVGPPFLNFLFRRSNADDIIGYSIKDIACPIGFKRMEIEDNSFASWLRDLPLKTKGSKVYLFDGRLKNDQSLHYAVIDIDIGNRDLQQCADAIMRLRAEYLYQYGSYDNIHFNFVCGFKADYSKWLSGYNIKVSGNKCTWVRSSVDRSGYKNFRRFMDIVFAYANTHSFEKELIRVEDVKEAKIGDIFIQGGFPGHAVIIVDMAENKEGEKIFLLAQSYMPAQNIHIIKSFGTNCPWYGINFGDELKTPEWVFKKSDLKKFKPQ